MRLTKWLTRYGVLLVGAGLVVVGLVLYVVAPGEVTAFGWTSYRPLDVGGPDWPIAYMTTQRITGLTIGIVGLLVLAGGIGFRLGARKARKPLVAAGPD